MVSRAILVLPRLFLGVIFTIAAYGKITAPAPGFKAHLVGFLTQALPDAHPAYQSFANSVVLPNAPVFATLIIAGELFVGLAMLFGFATRAASVIAVFLLLNYMLSKGMTLWSPGSNDAADVILAIVVGLGAAGRAYGIDRRLAERYPRVPIW